MTIIIENVRHSAEDLSQYFVEKEATFIAKVVEIYNQRSFPTLGVFSNLVDDLETYNDHLM